MIEGQPYRYDSHEDDMLSPQAWRGHHEAAGDPPPPMLYVATMIAAHVYLIGAIAAGIAWDKHWVTTLALASAGITYLCFLAQLANQYTVAVVLVPMSIAVGALAGVFLVI
jgi:hypothetical protein